MPKVTVITRKAYGGAYDVMSSKHIRGDMNFAWPTRGDRGDGRRGRGQRHLQGDDRRRPPIRRRSGGGWSTEYEAAFSNPYIAASRGYIDEVILPRETRPRLIRALEILADKRDTNPRKKHGNIPL